MAFIAPSAEHPATIHLSNEEQDDLTNRAMAGDTDEALFADECAVTRIGRRVLTEHEGRFFCEEYPSGDAASERYAEIATELIFVAC